jgi:hypothetical protein
MGVCAYIKGREETNSGKNSILLVVGAMFQDTGEFLFCFRIKNELTNKRDAELNLAGVQVKSSQYKLAKVSFKSYTKYRHTVL